MPYISIVVPVYNSAQTINRCIESIIRQTFCDFELIIIDDGSKDESFNICIEFAKKDNRIHVYKFENGGVANARNRGISLAIGDYLMFVDSDDYLFSNYCSSFVDAQNCFGKDILYISGIKMEHLGEDTYINYSKQMISYLTRRDIVKLYNANLLNSPCNKLYNTEIVRKFGLKMRTGINIGEDLIFNLEYLDVLCNTPICVLNNVLYIYTQNINSLTHLYHKNYYDIHMSIHRIFIEKCEKWHISSEDYAAYYQHLWVTFHDCFHNNMKDPNSNILSKIKYNTSIMKSNEFKLVLEYNKEKISVFKYLIYRLKNYGIIFILKIIKGEIVNW